MSRERPGGARVELRSIDLTDLDALHAIYGDPQVTEHLSFDPRSRDEVARILESAIAESAARPRRTYTYAVQETGARAMVGVIRFDRMGVGTARVGFAFRSDVWRRGYGRETVMRALDLAFGEPSAGGLGLHEVTAARAPENERSARLMHGLGFVDNGLIDIPTATGSRSSPECSISADAWVLQKKTLSNLPYP